METRIKGSLQISLSQESDTRDIAETTRGRRMVAVMGLMMMITYRGVSLDRVPT